MHIYQYCLVTTVSMVVIVRMVVVRIVQASLGYIQKKTALLVIISHTRAVVVILETVLIGQVVVPIQITGDTEPFV